MTIARVAVTLLLMSGTFPAADFFAKVATVVVVAAIIDGDDKTEEVAQEDLYTATAAVASLIKSESTKPQFLKKRSHVFH